MAALHTYVRTFDAKAHSGTLIVVPVVNPLNLAYRHHTKDQPRGQGYSNFGAYNTWKRWPGKRDGSPAQRICAALASQIPKSVAAVINFHCWSWHSATCAMSSGGGGVLEQQVLERLGIPFFLEGDRRPPKAIGGLTLQNYAGHVLKVPGFLIELRTHWWILPESHAYALRAIRNACRCLGIRNDPLEVEPRQYHLSPTTQEIAVKAPVSGLYVPRVEIETRVEKGAVLGDVYDQTSGDSVRILSPIAGVVWLNNRIGRQADVVYEDGHAFAEKGDLVALVREVM
jgi:predicted deacylase